MTDTTKVVAKFLSADGWQPLASEDALDLIAKGSERVWVDITAKDPPSATPELERFTSSCPQLEGIDPHRAARGNDYPPRYPPKAKAFGRAIFARAYWISAKDFPYVIRAQEVHVIAGQSFALTLRYHPRDWDMRDFPGPGMDSRSRRDYLDPDEVEKDVAGLHDRLGRGSKARKSFPWTRSSSFGLEVAIAVLDQIIDSMFETLNAIRLEADDLEGRVLQHAGDNGAKGGKAADKLPERTLNIRRLLRQVRWSFLPSDEISELRSGPFLGLEDPGIDLQLEDLGREADRAIATVRDVIEQVHQIVELSNSLKTQRLDRTIYALTIAATVLLVPTLMAGLWGMNFERIPGTGLNNGFWLALLILGVMSAAASYAIRWYLRPRRFSSKGARELKPRAETSDEKKSPSGRAA